MSAHDITVMIGAFCGQDKPKLTDVGGGKRVLTRPSKIIAYDFKQNEKSFRIPDDTGKLLSFILQSQDLTDAKNAGVKKLEALTSYDLLRHAQQEKLLEIAQQAKLYGVKLCKDKDYYFQRGTARIMGLAMSGTEFTNQIKKQFG